MKFTKSSMVAVEVTLGSRKVGIAVLTSDAYVKLRQACALGHNNCFVLDEEGMARWASRAINHYEGWDRRGVRIVPLPSMDTKSYQGRWMDFEREACEVLGLTHLGYEMAGKVEGYVPDGIDALGLCWEIKSRRGQYRKGQVKKH